MVSPRNSIEFRLWGRYALFTDPLSKIGGEKCSYHLPTYEALKGVVKSIYWKPTIIWVIDELRVMREIRTQTKGMKPVVYGGRGGNELAIYTFLTGDAGPDGGAPGVEYQVRAHFEWNEHRPELLQDRVEGKHFAIVRRVLERGGRQDIFLGTRDCQGYVEPCRFGTGAGAYDAAPEIAYGLTFHSFGYPDETGLSMLTAHFWRPVMRYGRIAFPPRGECIAKTVRPMGVKRFGVGQSVLSVECEAEMTGVRDELA